MAAKYPVIIVNSTLGIVLKFTPNPNSLRFESRKIFSQTQTLEGFVFEHWGEAPGVLKVGGITSGMNTSKGEAIAEAFMFALKQLYRVDKKRVASLLALVKSGGVGIPFTAGGLQSRIKRQALKPEDYTTLSDTYIYYRFDAYKGFFTDFSFEQVGTLPNIYTYQFSFLVTSTAQNFLADAMFTPTGSPAIDVMRAVAGGALITGSGAIANAIQEQLPGVGVK